MTTHQRIAKTKRWLQAGLDAHNKKCELERELSEIQDSLNEKRAAIQSGLNGGIRSGAISRPTENTACEIVHKMKKEESCYKSRIDVERMTILRVSMKLGNYRSGNIITYKQEKALELYYCGGLKDKDIAEIMRKLLRLKKLTVRTIQNWKRSGIERMSI